MVKMLCMVLLPYALLAEWIMFADKDDTYLYNNQTGEVYIRHKQKKENYKDFFVRMPSGVIPAPDGSLKSTPVINFNKNTTPPAPNTLDQEAAKKMTQEALKQVGNLLYEGS